MSIDVRVPSLGESVAEATIAQWLRWDEGIAELETEKITREAAAPADGVIVAVHDVFPAEPGPPPDRRRRIPLPSR